MRVLPHMMRRPTLRRLGVVAATLVTLWIAHPVLLTSVGSFMTVEISIEHADVILPMYQDPETIPAAAAEWLRRGYGKRIVLYRQKPGRLERLGLRPPRHETMRRLLESHGVPFERITEIGDDIDSNVELIGALAAHLDHRATARVLIVSAAPQSRLTWKVLQNAANGRLVLGIDAVTPKEFSAHNWWTNRDGLITYFDSYTLWLLRMIQ